MACQILSYHNVKYITAIIIIVLHLFYNTFPTNRIKIIIIRIYIIEGIPHIISDPFLIRSQRLLAVLICINITSAIVKDTHFFVEKNDV